MYPYDNIIIPGVILLAVTVPFVYFIIYLRLESSCLGCLVLESTAVPGLLYIPCTQPDLLSLNHDLYLVTILCKSYIATQFCQI
jgi:hypothetical protein